MKHFSPEITKRLRKAGKSGGGRFGVYFKIADKKGIKLLKRKFDSSKQAEMSEAFHKAKIEELNLKMARQRFSYIPKCYGVKVVKLQGKFRVGIIMQHLGGVTLNQMRDKYNKDYKVFDGIKVKRNMEKRLRQAGINHGDIHEGNLIYHAKKWWVIDFGVLDYNGTQFFMPRVLTKR